VKYQCFEVVVHAGIAAVRLDRPTELNTMIPQFWRELRDIATRLNADPKVRVVVLSSTGKHFSAGMHLDVFSSRDPSRYADPARYNVVRGESVRHFQDVISAVERIRVPVLAAIQGGCIGGALDLVTACDMRYATGDAFFVIQETNIGITADAGTLQRLPTLIPDGIAREYAYTGNRLHADRAREIGLLNEVFADFDEMMTAVDRTAETIASKSPLAIAGTKSALLYSRDHSVREGLDRSAIWSAAALSSHDMQKALQAQRGGHPAQFDDLPDFEWDI
jgi:enoyl-CoA hydratase